MKKYIIIASIALASLTTSCDVERLPGSSIVLEEAFESFQDAENFRTGNYALYRNSNYNYIRLISDMQVDVINAVSDYGNRGGLFYLWQDGLGTDYDIQAFYQTQYQAISNINSFIDNIDNVEPANEEQAETIKSYKGEAYLMRASLFHNLVRYFAKAYNPATADTDLGIALTLEYDPTYKPGRASLKETYDQIQSDLNNAKNLMKDGGSANSIYLTKDFAHAIQARVSLERGEWQQAIDAANLIIPKYALQTTVEGLKNQWKNDESSEVLVTLYASLQEGSGDASIGYNYLGYHAPSRTFRPDFVPSKKTIEAFEDGDIRKEVYFTKEKVFILGTSYNDVTLINKYPGNIELQTNPTIPVYKNKSKLFMISEAYLIKAEAQARGNIGDAVGTLNELRASRGASSLSGDPLTLVKEERFREMLAEGQRLLDLKRWGEGLNRTGGQTQLADGGLFVGGDTNAPNMTKPASDKMWVWEIPANDLRTNPNMKPNW